MYGKILLPQIIAIILLNRELSFMMANEVFDKVEITISIDSDQLTLHSCVPKRLSMVVWSKLFPTFSSPPPLPHELVSLQLGLALQY